MFFISSVVLKLTYRINRIFSNYVLFMHISLTVIMIAITITHHVIVIVIDYIHFFFCNPNRNYENIM